MSAEEQRKELLNLVGNVKARLDRHSIPVAFPIPQFIVVGKQSVGKSRLIEALAGETFNFVSGTLGSRRPTVLEFRNVAGLTPSKWHIWYDDTSVWREHRIEEVMAIIGQAHEKLGNDVTEVPVRVKVEGEECVDLGLVDLPGFRSFAADAAGVKLKEKIESMVRTFMADPNNVMVCVEEAGDAANLQTLAMCREFDPGYKRTILVRNKLDKYYEDLTPENVNKWLQGYGDIPENLTKFALSLPHWTGDRPPKQFGLMRADNHDADISTLTSKGCSAKFLEGVGFQHFRTHIENEIQERFAAALQPLLEKLRILKDEYSQKSTVIATESSLMSEANILYASRGAGISFARSFNFLMEGALSSEMQRVTLEAELRDFKAYVERSSTAECKRLKDEISEVTGGMDGYIDYLRDVARVPGMDVQVNGGAQFRRLMYEVEVFTRFASFQGSIEEDDIVRARGAGSNWDNVIEQLVGQHAPDRIKTKTWYVAERLSMFFKSQKEAVLNFMLTIKGSPEEHLYSACIQEQAEIIDRNATMKACIFKAFDEAVDIHQAKFKAMYKDALLSMTSLPVKTLKTSSMPLIGDTYEEECLPAFDDTKARIEEEMQKRGSMESGVRGRIRNIPTDDGRAGEALKMVVTIIEETFGCIRSMVADQMELYSESFFLMPMLRRLEGHMANLELLEEDKAKYRRRMETLITEKTKTDAILVDVTWCVEQVHIFKVTRGGGKS